MRFLISALGKPDIDPNNQYNYINTDYKFVDENETIPYSTPFLFEAILRHYQDKKENIDHLILIGTANSCWQDVYNYCCAQGMKEDGNSQILTEKRAESLNEQSDDTEVEKFERFLHPVEEKIEEFFEKEYKLKLKVHIFLTQYGTTEKQAFYNYKRLRRIEEFMPDGEEQDVLLDITHSFRYLPIYHFLVMNYLMQLSKKKVNVSAVYYGKLEPKSGEKSCASVLNMRYLISTLKWINSVNEVNSYGSVYHMKECLDKEKPTDGKEGIKKESEYTDWLEIFEWSANVNNFNAMTRSIEEIIREPKEKNYAGLGQDAVEKVSEEFKEHFSVSEKWKIAFEQLHLSQWFFEQRRFGLAAITIQECVTSFAVYTLITKEERERKKEGVFNRKLREKAIERLEEISEKNSGCRELYDRFMAGKDMRNTMAHSLGKMVVENKKSSEILSQINKDRKQLNGYIEFVEKALKDEILENKYTDSLKKNSQEKKLQNKNIDSLKKNSQGKNLHNKNIDVLKKNSQKSYGRIVCIAKKKEEWEWKNLLTREALKKEDIGFINLPDFEKDYQTEDQIEKECEEIFVKLKQECNKCIDKKCLVLIGNTNMEKQVYLIQEIPKEKGLSGRCVVKMLSESKQKIENKIVVQDKNIPYKSKKKNTPHNR